jgi:membrane protein required for colicin V production
MPRVSRSEPEASEGDQMWLNALALVVFAACIAAGAWAGALVTGLRIAALVVSYAAAVVLGPVLAPALGAPMGLGDGLLAALVSSSAVFLVASLGFGFAVRAARRRGPRDNVGRSPRDRFLGAVFGAVRGALLAVMVVYLAMWFDALRATGRAAVVPEVGDSAAADVTSRVVSGAIASVVDTRDPGARFLAEFAAQPAASAADLQTIFADPDFVRLRDDTRFWNDVEDGNVDAALERSSFVRLADDAQLRHRMARLGLVAEEDARDGDRFRQSMAQVLTEIGPRLRALHHDPAVRELLADPEVAAMLRNGDTVALLAHPKFRALVSRVGANGS